MMKRPFTRPRGWRISAVALLVCLSLLLGGCSLFAPRVPSLTIQENLPVLSGVKHAKEINRELADYFSAIVNGLSASRLQQQSYQVAYKLTEGENGYTLQSFLVGEGAASHELPPIALGSKTEFSLPESIDVRAFSSPAFLSSLLTLSLAGVEVDLYRYGEIISYRDACRMLVTGYESLMGEEQEVSGDDEGTRLFQKSLLLGFCDFDRSSFDDENYHVTFQSLTSMVANFMKITEKNRYFRYSDAVTQQDVGRLFRLFQSILLGIDVYGQDAAIDGWYTTLEGVDIDPFLQRAGDNTSPVTRLQLAKILVPLYESAFSEIPLKDQTMTLKDTEDIDALKAAEKFLLPNMPSFSFFSPDYVVRAAELPGQLQYFIANTYYNWFSNDTPAIDETTYDQVVVAAGILVKNYSGLGAAKGEVKTVNLSRDYDWYYSQNDSGQFSDINCMPAITSMGLKWKLPGFSDTPEILRSIYPNLQSGWFMETVESTLDKYGVEFIRQDNTLENMIADLDNGRILLAQISETDPQSQGHSFVVFGYRSFGDSLEFMAYDPQKLPAANLFGGMEDKTLFLEKNYCFFIINRFSHYYLAIPA